MLAIFWLVACLCWDDVVAFASLPRRQQTHHVVLSSPTNPFSSSVSALVSTGEDVEGEPALSVRAAVFQAPEITNQSENPLAVLTQVADSLRVAATHGVDAVLFPELYLTGTDPIDRESRELNIVGNVCGEVNVACAMGYAERAHVSDGPGEAGSYNSIAAFHADGSRAGNYRSISQYRDGDEFRRGEAFVESLPTTLRLPARQGQDFEREIKAGLTCGRDLLMPEHCRHLVRSGSQVLFASTSFRDSIQELRVINSVVPTRALENQVPLMLANFAERTSNDDDDDSEAAGFAGSSAILSQNGEYLVCGPRVEDGDMPYDTGYMIPCESGVLFAADVDITEASYQVFLCHTTIC
ncbi:hypothetical protein ACHAWF_012480 [Thalassiosira exigua]